MSINLRLNLFDKKTLYSTPLFLCNISMQSSATVSLNIAAIIITSQGNCPICSHNYT